MCLSTHSGGSLQWHGSKGSHKHKSKPQHTKANRRRQRGDNKPGVYHKFVPAWWCHSGPANTVLFAQGKNSGTPEQPAQDISNIKKTGRILVPHLAHRLGDRTSTQGKARQSTTHQQQQQQQWQRKLFPKMARHPFPSFRGSKRKKPMCESVVPQRFGDSCRFRAHQRKCDSNCPMRRQLQK